MQSLLFWICLPRLCLLGGNQLADHLVLLALCLKSRFRRRKRRVLIRFVCAVRRLEKLFGGYGELNHVIHFQRVRDGRWVFRKEFGGWGVGLLTTYEKKYVCRTNTQNANGAFIATQVTGVCAMRAVRLFRNPEARACFRFCFCRCATMFISASILEAWLST